jgi:hypothetical protein
MDESLKAELNRVHDLLASLSEELRRLRDARARA